MKSNFVDRLNEEYQEFLESDGVTPPKGVSDAILESVRQELHPNPWKVFSKLSAIHFVVGVVTLALCPQFGVRWFGEGLGLMRYFAHFGTYGCMVACGAFFIGSSVLLAGLLLKPEEVRAIRGQEWLQVFLLGSLSLGAFLMADAEIVFGFAAAWMLGSLLGGVAMLELSWMLRRKVLA